MASLSAGDAAAAPAEEVEAETAVGDEQPPAAAAVTGTDADEEKEEESISADAAVSSLSAPTTARVPPLEENLESEASEGLLCPIFMALLDDPVVLMADGITYSCAAIEQHLAFCRERGKPLSSPSTNMEITDPVLTMLAPNVMARGLVLDYKAEAERQWRDAGGKVVAGKGFQ